MWIYLLQGIGFGLAAAAQPGPFQTYLISQSLTRGWRRTLPAALAPLISDGPIILVCLLVLSQVPPWMENALYGVSGLFILYLAYDAFSTWRGGDLTTQDLGRTTQSVWKAAFMNALSPGPYIFWTLVTGPILVAGWRDSSMHGIGFLAGFYGALVCALAGMIFVFGLTAKFGPRVKQGMVGISSIVLLLFGVFQLSKVFF